LNSKIVENSTATLVILAIAGYALHRTSPEVLDASLHILPMLLQAVLLALSVAALWATGNCWLDRYNRGWKPNKDAQTYGVCSLVLLSLFGLSLLL
jgi:hypothetical protein